MATAVPYTGDDTVSPQERPAQRVWVDAPAAAFGTGIAQATEGLGTTMEGAGKELFDRAIAMQQLNQETDAQAKGTSAMQEMGQLHAEFTQKEGANAGPDALNKLNTDLDAVRQKYRNQLNSPYAQKLYDTDTYSIMGRTAFNAAGHSGEQLKVYATGVNNDRVKAAADEAQTNPADERAFQSALADAEHAARENGALHGRAPQQIEDDVKDAKSGIISNRILGMARNQPQAAQKMMDDALADGSLRGDNINKVASAVQKSLYTVGAKQTADAVRDGTSWEMGNKIIPIDRAADAIAMGIESGGNYSAKSRPGPNGEQALGKYQVMSTNLPGWLAEAGMKPMTPDEFLADHDAQDQLFQSKFGSYMKTYGSFNDAAAKWFTGRSLGELKGANPTDRDNPSMDTNRYLTAVNKRLAATANTGETVAVGRKIAATTAPSDPLYGDAVENHIITQRAQEATVKRQDTQDDLLSIEKVASDAILGGKPLTIDALRMNPDTAAAIDRLDPPGLIKLQNTIKEIAAQDNTETDARQGNLLRLKGLATTDSAAFLDTQLLGTDLTADGRKELMQIKEQVKKGAYEKPELQLVMSNPDVQIAMSAAGISKDNKPDGYNHYKGLVQNIIESYQKAGQTLSTKDMVKIGTDVIYQTDPTDKGGHWFTNPSRIVDTSIPPSKVDGLRDQFFKAKGRYPQPEEMNRMWEIHLYELSLNKGQQK